MRENRRICLENEQTARLCAAFEYLVCVYLVVLFFFVNKKITAEDFAYSKVPEMVPVAKTQSTNQYFSQTCLQKIFSRNAC